eukprot:4501981-Amphidinium_carterae.1
MCQWDMFVLQDAFYGSSWIFSYTRSSSEIASCRLDYIVCIIRAQQCFVVFMSGVLCTFDGGGGGADKHRAGMCRQHGDGTEGLPAGAVYDHSGSLAGAASVPLRSTHTSCTPHRKYSPNRNDYIT